MDFAIGVCMYLVAVPLQLLVIATFLRGSYRRYPFLFALAIANFLTTVVEVNAYVTYYLKRDDATRHFRVAVYWVDEIILQVLVYAAVMSLLYSATSGLKSRRIVRASLLLGALLFAGISFLVHHNPADPLGAWMTPWSRDLNVCATILDLALWALLLASRERDTTLLMISGSLGIMFTGEAMGSSLRDMSIAHKSRMIANFGNAAIMLSNVAFLLLLWQALRSQRRAKKRAAPAGAAPKLVP